MKSPFRKLLSVALVGLAASILTSCSSSPYSSAPPGGGSAYMGVSYYDGFYGGPWYGPGYRPPTVVVPPRPRPPVNRPTPLPAPMPRRR